MGLCDNLCNKFKVAQPTINQVGAWRRATRGEWNKSWELPDNHRLTFSINIVTKPCDILKKEALKNGTLTIPTHKDY